MNEVVVRLTGDPDDGEAELVFLRALHATLVDAHLRISWMLARDSADTEAVELRRTLEEGLSDIDTILPASAKVPDLSLSRCRQHPESANEVKQDVYTLFRESVTLGAEILCDENRFRIARWVYRFSPRNGVHKESLSLGLRRPTLSKR